MGGGGPVRKLNRRAATRTLLAVPPAEYRSPHAVVTDRQPGRVGETRRHGRVLGAGSVHGQSATRVVALRDQGARGVKQRLCGRGQQWRPVVDDSVPAGPVNLGHRDHERTQADRGGLSPAGAYSYNYNRQRRFLLIAISPGRKAIRL